MSLRGRLQPLSPYCAWKVLNKERGLTWGELGWQIARVSWVMSFRKWWYSKEAECILLIVVFCQCSHVTNHILLLLSWKWFSKSSVQPCFLDSDLVVKAEFRDLWEFCLHVLILGIWTCKEWFNLDLHWNASEDYISLQDGIANLYCWISSCMSLNDISLMQIEWLSLPVHIYILRVINLKGAAGTMTVDVTRSCKAVVVAHKCNCIVCVETFWVTEQN